ncbi:MAG: hypothetical protein ACRD4Y_03295, partial [Candidatus Acidiferrales bacterium]
AGKPAKFMRWTTMADEHVHVEFHLDPDLALVGVLRGAVQFQALNAGLMPETGEAVAGASEAICRESLNRLAEEDGGLDVSLDTFADRIEVSILHRGEPAPVVGLDRFAVPDIPSKCVGGMNGRELLSRVDRVLYRNEDGKVRTTLVKFRKSAK